jgi:hypothetical protein
MLNVLTVELMAKIARIARELMSKLSIFTTKKINNKIT